MYYQELKVNERIYIEEREEEVVVLGWTYNQVIVLGRKGIIHLAHTEVPSCKSNSLSCVAGTPSSSPSSGVSNSPSSGVSNSPSSGVANPGVGVENQPPNPQCYLFHKNRLFPPPFKKSI